MNKKISMKLGKIKVRSIPQGLGSKPKTAHKAKKGKGSYNRKTFKQFKEEGGAGEEGTTKATNKYKKDTPEQ